MMTVDYRQLSILVSKEGDWWVAQCIEHDLATQAHTREDLEIAIASMFEAHEQASIELGITPYQVAAAPEWVRKRFAAATRISLARISTTAGTALDLTIHVDA